MNDNEIIEYLGIDRHNPKAFYQQLIDRLEDFIAINPVETRLPPERHLAKNLKLDRTTVKKAIQTFVDCGQIIRNGRRGTFIAGRRNPFKKLHPMMLEEYNSEPFVKDLHFLLYENSESFKKFWEEAISAYNISRKDINITTEWLSENVGLSEYPDYLKKNSPDIFQMNLKNDIKYKLADLPEYLKEKLSDDSIYYANNLGTPCKDALKNLVPVHFSNMAIFWNRDLAEKYKLIDIEKRLHDGEALELFKEARRVLPEKLSICGNAWNYFQILGIPEDEKTIDKDFFLDRFTEMFKVAGLKNLFITEQAYPLEIFEKFFSGHSLFIATNANMIFHQKDYLDFKLGYFYSYPQDGLILPAFFSALGVSENLEYEEEAFKFLEFVLSSETQKKLTQHKVACSYMKKPNLLFIGNKEIDDEKRLMKSIDGLRNMGFKKKHLSNFIMFRIKDVFHKLMNNILTSNEAADISIKGWRKYYNVDN